MGYRSRKNANKATKLYWVWAPLFGKLSLGISKRSSSRFSVFIGMNM